MADLQWTHGSDDADVSYSKLQAMGGLAWCEREWRRGMYFGAHVLAGISQVRASTTAWGRQRHLVRLAAALTRQARDRSL
jgi:hypothetical protein